MPLGVAVLRDCQVVYLNASLLDLLGRERGEVLGCPALSFLSRPDASDVRNWNGSGATKKPLDAWLRTPRGEVRVELTSVEHGDAWLVHVRDVTARVRRRELLEQLAELGAELPTRRSEAQVLGRMFEGLEAMSLAFAWVVPGQEGPLLERGFAPGGPEPLSARRGAWTPGLEQAWSEGCVFVEDATREAARFLGVGAEALRAEPLPGVVARVDLEGAPRALLAVAAVGLREEDRAPVRRFATQVSAALDAALTITRLSARNTALAALNRLASAAASAPHPRAFFGPGTEEIAGLLGCDAVTLLLPEEGRLEAPEFLELIHAHGFAREVVARHPRTPVTGTVNGVVFLSGEARVVDAEDCPPPTREALLQQGFQTLAAVPVRVRSRVVGTLGVLFRVRRRLTPLELETLQAMGSHFAAALESHRLLEEVRGRAEDLALMHEVGKALAATLEPAALLSTGVTSLARIVDTPDAYVMLPDATGERLIVRAATGGHPAMVGQSIPVEPPPHSFTAEVFHTRQPLRVEDAREDPRGHEELLRLSEGLAFLVLPLAVHERMVGVAMVVETRRTRRFTAAEVERAGAIASQLSLALEGARLVEDLKKSYAELARAQAQLVHRERLAALGELSAVVAHEVRNPLGAIFNSVATIRRIVGPESPATPLVDIVGEEADRLNRIVADLLTFARPPSPHPYPVSVSQLLEESVRGALADQGAPRDLAVRVEWSVATDVPPVTVDERLMRQAFLNLALNAVQAMPHGGTLSVSASRAFLDRDGVQVDFTDTGVGIPVDVRPRIFEPFFTTKAQGTGLGLAVVKRIVESHLGQLSLVSTGAEGTTFRLFLPVDAPAPG
ncbi:histidine kinase [Corallococcus sp. H22C18031201]|nr:histidine kinase [Corallococcus sp. H22C18031201]